jgi:hypothetical protein
MKINGFRANVDFVVDDQTAKAYSLAARFWTGETGGSARALWPPT